MPGLATAKDVREVHALRLISALLEASEFMGRGIVRVLLISPFFIMPTVGALIWKNLIFHPVSGVLAAVWKLFGAQPVDWLAHYPLLSIIIIVSWQWLPCAILLLMTAMQSLDQEQKEAARLSVPPVPVWDLPSVKSVASAGYSPSPPSP